MFLNCVPQILYIHLPDENLCSSKLLKMPVYSCMLTVRRKNWYHNSVMSGSYSQEHGMSLLPSNLSSAIQKFSLCSGKGSVTSLLKNYMDPTSILIYLKSTKMNKCVSWICHKWITFFIMQYNVLFYLTFARNKEKRTKMSTLVLIKLMSVIYCSNKPIQHLVD